MEKSSGSSDSRDISTLGCGTDLGPTSPPSITLNINTTTGGNFAVIVENHNTVEILKKIIAKKLRVSKDRICLLHRERELLDGTLKENGLMDGSKIILIPNVETGLLAQRSENNVMQALESLNDSQVNDFLSGKSPLNLSMRLGDHMMLIQLQLSTLNPASSSSSSSTSSSSQSSTYKSRPSSSKIKASSSSAFTTLSSSPPLSPCSIRRQKIFETFGDGIRIPTPETISSSATPSPSAAAPSTSTFLSTSSPIKENEVNKMVIQKLREIERLSKQYEQERTSSGGSAGGSGGSVQHEQQSPIKSLSNLVSSPMKATQLLQTPLTPLPTASTSCSSQDPISAKLTSCLCKSLDTNSNSGCVNCPESSSTVIAPGPLPSPSTPTSSITPSTRSLLHKTANNPIVRHKLKNTTALSLLRKAINTIDNYQPQLSSKSANIEGNSTTTQSAIEVPEIATTPPSTPPQASNSVNTIPLTTATQTTTLTPTATTSTAVVETCALAEASRNLTQTLRKLSKEVFTNKLDIAEDNSRRMGTGAVIQTMKHHGQGIYSGTFSGTLNPALQDRYGRPKRDISTIIHILNDLLSAAPQYRRSSRSKLDAGAGASSVSISTPSSSSSSVAGGSHRNMQWKEGSSSSTRRLTQSSQTDQEGGCVNCLAASNIVHTCPYGECKGHMSSSGMITSTPTCSKTHHSTIAAAGAVKSNSSSKTATATCLKHSTNTTIPSCLCSQQQQPQQHQDGDSILSNFSLDESSLDDSAVATINFACRCNSVSSSSILSSSSSSSSASSSLLSTSSAYCMKCTSTEMENNKTKCKLDHLRLVMQQKKEKREARKLKSMPYNRVVGTATAAQLGSSAVVDAGGAASSSNHMVVVEEVDAAA